MTFASLPRPTVAWLVAALAFPLSCHAQAPAANTNHVPADYAGKPFSGQPATIPGTVQAEEYDVVPGGEAKGVTFEYTGRVGKTPLRPEADSVGMARYGKGHVSVKGEAEAPEQGYIGWTDTGEWLRYTVRVAETGTYVLGGKFAAGGAKTLISLSFGPDQATGPVSIPTTAGFQPGVEVYHVWETLDDLKEIKLAAGTYVMTFKIDHDDGLNVDYFTFKKKS